LLVVAEIIMLVNSIDPLAPYKVSDDLMLELVSVTAIIKGGSFVVEGLSLPRIGQRFEIVKELVQN